MRSILRVFSTALLIAGSGAAEGPAGYPSRTSDLDVLPGFRHPPPGYGEVSFYWWLGDPLTKERLTWQLDQLKDRSISGLQVNYAHSDKGGRSYGLTYASEPPLFSDGWWDLFGWFLKEAWRYGMSASLSDYTLGWAGNGWYMDEILREHPDMSGAALARETHDCEGACAWEVPDGALSVTAYRLENGRFVQGSEVDLLEEGRGGKLEWNAPPGMWRVVAVSPKRVPLSLDPMHPLSGRQMNEKFFERFERRNPGESGKGLNFFFSDELSFGVRGWLWNADFAGEFKKRKGYDVRRELASLFEDTGPRAIKVRLDYSDVMVALSEENYFRPTFEWHQSRGMLYGCDHGGRGQDVTEFGDYFRTQRWVTGPGNDQPDLGSDVVKNKVASSIAHLYERPRTWLEGYYGSGWGTTSAQIVDATWRNFAQGHNLLTLHGLYYSTRGGWWEWAPPCNHFRMPYWAHMGEFLRASERMSYLLSQGHHRADVAVVYPVAPVEAGLGGKESVEAAFSLGRHLYGEALDFDFIDFESMARAKVEDRKLKVAGEEYRVLVLPAMRAVRHAMLEKAVEFHRAGGLVIVLGAAPQASERTGDRDERVLALSRVLSASAAQTNQEVAAKIGSAFQRDFVCRAAGQPSILHRRAGPRDLYMVYGAEKGSECSFRATGRAELWDPWTGGTSELEVLSQENGVTRIRMPLNRTEAQLIVFSAGSPRIEARKGPTGEGTIPIEGAWGFEQKPTLDNRFGDYRLPATNSFIGPEARRLRYTESLMEEKRARDPNLDDSKWGETAITYGQKFWKLGPLPKEADSGAVERRLRELAAVDPSIPIEAGGKRYGWSRYEFSWRWGIENDPGHQGYHGLKAEVPEDFIGLGKLTAKATTTVYEEETGGSRYYLWSTVHADRAMRARIVRGGELQPAAEWVGGERVVERSDFVDLKRGHNTILLAYDRPGRGHWLLLDASSPTEWRQEHPLASSWHNRPGILPFDTRPGEAAPTGWYRMTAPPGLRGLKMVARGSLSVWVDGEAAPMPAGHRREDGATEYRIALHAPRRSPSQVTLRIRQERGAYGGAALSEPVEFECGAGEIAVGEWSSANGLGSYSGGAVYRKAVELTAEQVRGVVELELGEVSSSAEVIINGERAGVKLAPPYRVDVSRLVKAGENHVEVRVFSALSNHYQSIPTRYRKPSPSGLIGPVRIVVRPGGF